MKTFKNVSEWIASKPGKEEQQKVLNLVNKTVVVQMRKVFYKKTSELKKIQRITDSLKHLNIIVKGDQIDEELFAKVENLKTEINEIKNQLPVTKPRVKKVKNGINGK